MKTREIIKTIFYEHKEGYSSVSIAQELYRKGMFFSCKPVGRLLHESWLYAKGSLYKYKYYNPPAFFIDTSQYDSRENPKEGLIVHIDQNFPCTEARFQELFRLKKCKSSVSRKGNPYENGLMESFYRTLKRELVNDTHFASIEQAQFEIFKHLETYYNPKRLHSALGYQSLIESE